MAEEEEDPKSFTLRLLTNTRQNGKLRNKFASIRGLRDGHLEGTEWTKSVLCRDKEVGVLKEEREFTGVVLPEM